MASFPTLSNQAITFLSLRRSHLEARITLKWGCLLIDPANGREKNHIILINDMALRTKSNSHTLIFYQLEHDEIWLTFRDAEEAGIWLTAIEKCTGWLLGDFYIDLDQIDSGGYGDVYSVTQRAAGLRVVVKVVKLAPEQNMRELTHTWEFRQKILCVL